jgi:hypothetical protein
MNAEIDDANARAPYSGGLLGAALTGALTAEVNGRVNDARDHKAASIIAPLREELKDEDVAALAVATTKSALGSIRWFGARDIGIGRDASDAAMSAALDASATSQTAFFQYHYELSPNLGDLVVILRIEIALKAAGDAAQAEARLDKHHLVFAQTLTAVVRLSSPSKSRTENIRRWAADNGRLARQALRMAFADVGEMVPRALNLTEGELDHMTDQKYQTIDGYMGQIQDTTPDGTLSLGNPNHDLIHFRTLAP